MANTSVIEVRQESAENVLAKGVHSFPEFSVFEHIEEKMVASISFDKFHAGASESFIDFNSLRMRFVVDKNGAYRREIKDCVIPGRDLNT